MNKLSWLSAIYEPDIQSDSSDSEEAGEEDDEEDEEDEV